MKPCIYKAFGNHKAGRKPKREVTQWQLIQVFPRYNQVLLQGAYPLCVHVKQQKGGTPDLKIIPSF